MEPRPLQIEDIEKSTYERSTFWGNFLQQCTNREEGKEILLSDLDEVFKSEDETDEDWNATRAQLDNEAEEVCIDLDKFNKTDVGGRKVNEKAVMLYKNEDDIESDENFLNETRPILREFEHKWKAAGFDRILNTFDTKKIEKHVGGWLRRNNTLCSSVPKKLPMCVHNHNQTADTDTSDTESMHSVDTARYIRSSRKHRSPLKTCSKTTIKTFRTSKSKRDEIREKYSFPDCVIDHHQQHINAVRYRRQCRQEEEFHKIRHHQQHFITVEHETKHRLEIQRRKQFRKRRSISAIADTSSEEDVFYEPKKFSSNCCNQFMHDRRFVVQSPSCYSKMPLFVRSSKHSSISSLRKESKLRLIEKRNMRRVLQRHNTFDEDIRPYKLMEDCHCCNASELCTKVRHLVNSSTEEWLVENGSSLENSQTTLDYEKEEAMWEKEHIYSKMRNVSNKTIERSREDCTKEKALTSFAVDDSERTDMKMSFRNKSLKERPKFLSNATIPTVQKNEKKIASSNCKSEKNQLKQLKAMAEPACSNLYEKLKSEQINDRKKKENESLGKSAVAVGSKNTDRRKSVGGKNLDQNASGSGKEKILLQQLPKVIELTNNDMDEELNQKSDKNEKFKLEDLSRIKADSVDTEIDKAVAKRTLKQKNIKNQKVNEVKNQSKEIIILSSGSDIEMTIYRKKKNIEINEKVKAEENEQLRQLRKRTVQHDNDGDKISGGKKFVSKDGVEKKIKENRIEQSNSKTLESYDSQSDEERNKRKHSMVINRTQKAKNKGKELLKRSIKTRTASSTESENDKPLSEIKSKMKNNRKENITSERLRSSKKLVSFNNSGDATREVEPKHNKRSSNAKNKEKIQKTKKKETNVTKTIKKEVQYPDGSDTADSELEHVIEISKKTYVTDLQKLNTKNVNVEMSENATHKTNAQHIRKGQQSNEMNLDSLTIKLKPQPKCAKINKIKKMTQILLDSNSGIDSTNTDATISAADDAESTFFTNRSRIYNSTVLSNRRAQSREFNVLNNSKRVVAANTTTSSTNHNIISPTLYSTVQLTTSGILNSTPSTTVGRKLSKQYCSVAVDSDCTVVSSTTGVDADVTQKRMKKTFLNTSKGIILYTPVERELVPSESFRDNCFVITQQHLSKAIGESRARKFFQSYIGRKHFNLNSTIYFRPPPSSTPVCANVADTVGSDSESDDVFENFGRYGDLYESLSKNT